MIGLHK